MVHQEYGVCLNESKIKSFLNEQLSEQEEALIQELLTSCALCQSKMEDAAASQAMWDELRDHTLSDSPPNSTASPSINSLLEHLAPSEDPKFLGRLGTYDVTGVIGQGSTGIVVKAFEQRLSRYVAIKVLTPALASSGPARRRFEREGRAIAAVSHEHVVPIYAVDEYRGLPYIVMQYIPGLSLLQRIEKSGALGLCEIVRIGLQVARALAAAHGQGIVHRDVKPANVLLHGSIERAMVTDFGLAQVADDATMTRSGTISGTPQYMSPEQARGEFVDERTDLFSLGSLMYAACTARAPFRAETVYGIIHRVCNYEPRQIRELNPEISPWMCSFVDKLMAKDPADRFASAREVASILEDELAHLQSPTTNPEPQRKWVQTEALTTKVDSHESASHRWIPVVLTMGLLAAIAGFLSWNGNKNYRSQPEDSKQLASHTDEVGNSLKPSVEQKDLFESDANHTDVEAGANNDDGQITFNEQIPFGSFVALQPDDEPVEQWERDTDSQLALTANFTQRIDQAFRLPTSHEVRVNVDIGNIEVRHTKLEQISLIVVRRMTTGSEEEARKIASFHKLDVQEGEALVLEAQLDEDFVRRGGNKVLGQVTYGLALPTGVNVEINSDRGSIRVSNLNGNVTATSQAGDIRLARIGGDVWARGRGGEIVISDQCTGSVDLMCTHGNICVSGIEGKARLRSSDGSIYVGRNSGVVSAHATGGDVRIASVLSKTSAHVEVGDIILQSNEPPQADCRLSATSGSISLEIPDSANIAFEVLGNIESELEFTSAAPVSEGASTEEGASTWKAAKLNEGTNRFEITNHSGPVWIATQKTTTSESLGGSGNRYFSLGGSGSHSERATASSAALAKTSGSPRPGAMVSIPVEDGENIDGYTLYLPESYSDANPGYPVILYLQGAYGVGGPIEQLNDWGLPRLIRDETDLGSRRNQLLLDTFIVVSVHISSGQYDDHPEIIQRILGDVSSSYAVDSDQIYVTGLSRGGHASWNLVSKLPNVFAAAVPVGGEATIEDFAAFDNTAVWVAHNLRDPVVDWSAADAAAKKIEKAVGTSFLRSNRAVPALAQIATAKYVFTQPDVALHDAWTELYTSTEFYEWLLMQSKQ